MKIAAVISLLGLLVVGPAAADDGQSPAELHECGACHMVYPPQFLPVRSWTALVGNLDDHFGENAGLPAAKAAGILAYLTANAADGAATGERGRPFLRDLSPDAAPLRITETPWWMLAHAEVDLTGVAATAVKSVSNCGGCHRDVAQ